MGLWLCPWFGFPSQKAFKEKVLLDLVEDAKFYYFFILFEKIFKTTDVPIKALQKKIEL
jgi:hypothetical protein